MIIHSNINSTKKTHDLIAFESIEKQLFSILKEYGVTSYSINEAYIFNIKNYPIKLIFKKNNFALLFSTHNYRYDPSDIIYRTVSKTYHDISDIQVFIKFNVTLKETLDNFFVKINNIINFQIEYEILQSKKLPSDTEIENELGLYFNNDILHCRYFKNNTNTRFGFFITQIDSAPADGVYLLIKDCKITRDHNGYNMENLLYKLYSEGRGIEVLNKQLGTINYIDEKVNNFDINNFPLVLEQYNANLAVDKLLEKFKIKSRY